ncbi:hypothetical protein T07_3451 [Trichinella nelsoni]|uniref:Uncharacterized protein n=1 Tax=Trichinella nelsoni TaxID=6336 RepID=A0A0V0RIP8_9BILA|nr:hypothetical protein T07_3451 [Trichinella nelsoni]
MVPLAKFTSAGFFTFVVRIRVRSLTICTGKKYPLTNLKMQEGADAWAAGLQQHFLRAAKRR